MLSHTQGDPSLVPPAKYAAPNPFNVPPSPSPLVRCSRRLADKAELTGDRKVYSRDDRGLKPLFLLL
jgi:hypothetical protein